MEALMKEVCDYIHNYFVFDTVESTFIISDNLLQNDELELYEGQYFIIEGSKFNDGMFKYTEVPEETDLIDETFKGCIKLCSIPRDVQNIVKDIAEWQEKNAETLNSPFQSESFGGYSYSKGNSTTREGKNRTYSWKDVFGSKLYPYRKIG